MHVRPWERDEHVVVPVPRGQIPHRARCDFCNAEGDTPWLVLANDFVADDGWASQGHWGACQGCVSLVRRRRWSAVYARLLATEAAQPLDQRLDVPGRRKRTMAMWQRLEVNMLGVVPFREELNL